MCNLILTLNDVFTNRLVKKNIYNFARKLNWNIYEMARFTTLVPTIESMPKTHTNSF